MRFRHILSETRAGLRQNLTMTLAVIMTMWVSLSLFGALIEVFQSIPALHRDSDVVDWIADTAAGIVVLLLVRWWRSRA